MGLSNVLFRGFHEVDFHLRIHPQGRDARTEKAAKAHVFRIRLLLKVCSMGIDSPVRLLSSPCPCRRHTSGRLADEPHTYSLLAARDQPSANRTSFLCKSLKQNGDASPFAFFLRTCRTLSHPPCVTPNLLSRFDTPFLWFSIPGTASL